MVGLALLRRSGERVRTQEKPENQVQAPDPSEAHALRSPRRRVTRPFGRAFLREHLSVKWLSLIALLAATFSLVRVMRSRPRAVQIACVALGFSPFVPGNFHLTMAFVSWADWPGFVTGAEFSVVDALTLSIYLFLPRVQHPLPFRISFALYFLATLLSALQAFAPVASLFYSWQLARMFLVYVVIIRVCARPLHLSALFEGDVGRLVPRGDPCALGAIWIGLATNTRHLRSSEHTWHGYALQCLSVLCLAVIGTCRMVAFSSITGRYNNRAVDDIPRHDRTCPPRVFSCLRVVCRS